jgi:23S rRNA (guanosine2251-2'-O)-methyltransferase
MQQIKGKHAIYEALQSEAQIERIIIDYKSQNNSDIKKIISLARTKSIKVQIVPSQKFWKECAEENAQGIIAYTSEILQLDIADIVMNPKKYPLVLAVDHIEDPYNFGAIIRTAEIFGVKAIIYPKDRNSQITPGVIKVSSGAIHHLDIIKVVNLAQALQKLEKAGYWLYGADSNQGTDLDTFSPSFPLVLVVGNEHKGISTRISKMLHLKVKIPTIGKTDSLNVSVATGVISYHLFREAIKNDIISK